MAGTGNAPKSKMGFVLIVAAAVIYIVFWFTGKKPGERTVTVAGRFYIADRIDTLTALPAFEEFLRRERPRLVILDENAAFSLNLLESMEADSTPAWWNEVDAQFERRLRELGEDIGFEIKYIRPWRLNIFAARKSFAASGEGKDGFERKREAYLTAHEAAERSFPSDTLFNQPLLVNAPEFTATRNMERIVFEMLFDGELGAAGYGPYHERILASVMNEIDSSLATRVLVLCHPMYKAWFEAKLNAYRKKSGPEIIHETAE